MPTNRHATPVDYIPGPVNPALTRAAHAGGRPRLPRPRCGRTGCQNHVLKPSNKYCSTACRNTHLAPVYRQRARERAERMARVNTSATPPELREAFRLAVARVPSGEWPDEAREAYNAYIRLRRQQRQKEGPAARPERPPALEEAFQNISRHIIGSDWSREARDAYNAYQRERRKARQERLRHGDDPPPAGR